MTRYGTGMHRDRNPVGATYSPHIQTIPEANTAFCTKSTTCLSGDKIARMWHLTTHTHLVPRLKKEQSYNSTLPYLLTPWGRVLLENLTGCQLVKKFPEFVEPECSLPHSQMPVTCRLSLSWARSMQSTLPYYFLIFILILSSHLCLGLPSGLLPTTTLYTPPLSPIHATCPTYLILLNFINQTIFGEQNRSLSSLLCNFLHSLLPHPS